MNSYESFLESKLRRMEETVAAVRAGKTFWCESGQRWMDVVEELGTNPWAGGWPMCKECEGRDVDKDNVVGRHQVLRKERRNTVQHKPLRSP
jgi:hypothetical protein